MGSIFNSEDYLCLKATSWQDLWQNADDEWWIFKHTSLLWKWLNEYPHHLIFFNNVWEKYLLEKATFVVRIQKDENYSYVVIKQECIVMFVDTTQKCSRLFTLCFTYDIIMSTGTFNDVLFIFMRVNLSFILNNSQSL